MNIKIPEIAIFHYDDFSLIIITTLERYSVVKVKNRNRWAVESIAKYLPMSEKHVEEIIQQLPKQKINIVELSHKLPGIEQQVTNPITKEISSLWSIIIYLNDIEKWSREAIADWVEILDDVPTFEVKENADAITILVDETRFLPV